MTKNNKKLFINGEWKGGDNTYTLTSPYDGRDLAEIPIANKTEVLDAIESAKHAAKKMKALTSLERSKILERASEIFEERLEECAQILVKENAKPIIAARGEIKRTIETYKFAAEEAKRLSGEIVPMDAAESGKGKFGFTKKEPLGVIAAITPFNFPFNLTAHKLGPAFAVGNSVVLKPASQTPLSAIITGEIFEEAGLPTGALNIVFGSGGDVGDVLVGHPDIKMITFTGSVEVGTKIRESAGLKKVTLELGSNSAVIIDDIKDMDSLIQRCIEGIFSFSGQACISVQRIYVRAPLYEDFLDKLVEKAKDIKIGDPSEEDTLVSSLINQKEAERIETWLKEIDSSNVALGGKRTNSMIEPTILKNIASDEKVSCKEAFAPLVSVNQYETLDEAIDLVNDSEYGLQAGVYTDSVDKAFKLIEELEVGGVIVNDIPSFRVDQMPYGGVKKSGVGREGIKYSMDEMSELKLGVFNLEK